MPRAYLNIRNRDNLYLQDTRVENLFISEFLPAAPEGYVKVFLFGLMYAQNNMSLDTAKLSRVLRISESQVMQAWEYWAKLGLIKLESNRDFSEYNIEYVSQIDRMYAANSGGGAEQERKPAQAEEEAKNAASEKAAEEAIAKVIDMEISAIFRKYEELTGRTISSEEAWKISDTIKTFDILPDVMSFAVDYCASEDRASINQIIRTATNWAKEGCRNLVEVKKYIDEHSRRNQYYNLVFREMGWNRLPSPGDREIMDRWFDELGCSIKEVLDACRASAGLRDPSLKYVNKVIENRKLEAGGINTRQAARNSVQAAVSGGREATAPGNQVKAMVSRKVLREYYDYLRLESEKLQAARIDEVCSKILDLRELFEFETKLNRDLMSQTLVGDNKVQKQQMREQRRALEVEKRKLLAINGYSEDYLDRRYRCNACHDTGITDDGRVCACSEARAQEAYKWNLERNQ